MAQTFNAYIISARTKHIIYMLEEIRVALMQRLVKKKTEMEKKCTFVCPRVQEKLEKEKELAAMCTPLPSSDIVYQVMYGTDNLTVNLETRECTCKKWNLTGIPCGHAIAAIFDKYEKAEDYVDDCYKKETYLRIYGSSITPCPGERHWPSVHQLLNPPQIKVGPGRPRKNRRKDPFKDPKKSGNLTKHGLEMTCSVCKSRTHNKRKCPDKDKTIATLQPPKRERGRFRAAHNKHHTTNPATEAHHQMTAQPTRIGKGGRVINSGRGGRGGTLGGRGGAAGGRGGIGGRASGRGGAVGGRDGRGGGRGGIAGRSGRVPQGFGILYNDQGNIFTNSFLGLGGFPFNNMKQQVTPQLKLQ
ncbi:uncharacterized protein LOC141608938 [Silene latifolia]|uniref:uncharacterized protein LOC141608938 n=1 Tax=Silene latifolia TaxID=37657 RepID=UPI003D76F002